MTIFLYIINMISSAWCHQCVLLLQEVPAVALSAGRDRNSPSPPSWADRKWVTPPLRTAPPSLHPAPPPPFLAGVMTSRPSCPPRASLSASPSLTPATSCWTSCDLPPHVMWPPARRHATSRWHHLTPCDVMWPPDDVMWPWWPHEAQLYVAAVYSRLK